MFNRNKYFRILFALQILHLRIESLKYCKFKLHILILNTYDISNTLNYVNFFNKFQNFTINIFKRSFNSKKNILKITEIEREKQ